MKQLLLPAAGCRLPVAGYFVNDHDEKNVITSAECSNHIKTIQTSNIFIINVSNAKNEHRKLEHQTRKIDVNIENTFVSAEIKYFFIYFFFFRFVFSHIISSFEEFIELHLGEVESIRFSCVYCFLFIFVRLIIVYLFSFWLICAGKQCSLLNVICRLLM